MSYPLLLLGDNNTETPKNTEDTIAMEEPVGRSSKKETATPVKQHKTPMTGEKTVIFFMSYENWYAEDAGFTIKANTKRPPTNFKEKATVIPVKNSMR